MCCQRMVLGAASYAAPGAGARALTPAFLVRVAGESYSDQRGIQEVGVVYHVTPKSPATPV